MSETPAHRPFLIGITGGSASGKSTFARMLAEEIGTDLCTVIAQDGYFSDFSEVPEAEREAARSHNHPRSVRWEYLRADLASLRAGRRVDGVAPGTGMARADAADRVVEPTDFVIVEGHILLWDEEVRDLLDLKLYLEADPHERVLRRIQRTMAREGADLDAAIAWYRRDVIPNYPHYTETTRAHADLIVPFDRRNATAVRLIAAGLERLARELPTDPRATRSIS
ncbi:MAG: uridine kinase [Spirochaetota bacterium]